MGKEVDLSRKTITEDKDGNASITGKVSTEGAIVDAKDLTTKEYVDNAIAQASIGGEVDTSGFALKSEIPNIEGLASESFVNQQISEAQEEVDYKIINSKLWYDISNEIEIDLAERNYNAYIPNTRFNVDDYVYTVLNTSLNLEKDTCYYLVIGIQKETGVSAIITGEYPVITQEITDGIIYAVCDSRTTVYDNCDYVNGELIKADGKSVIKIKNAFSYPIKVARMSVMPTKYVPITDDFFNSHKFVSEEQLSQISTTYEQLNLKADKSELFSGSYNDLTNKPCYDTRITERKIYTYTCSVSNIPENGIIKVSDDTYTIEEIKNFSNVTITFDYMDDTASKTYNCPMLSESDYSLVFFPDQSGNISTAYICNGIVSIVLEDTGNTSAGTYFMVKADSDCIIEFSFDYLLSGEIKALDERYLVNKPGRIVYAPNPDGSGSMLMGETFNSCLNRAGAFSHAEGANTNAMGMSAHSEGFYTEANGTYSHAEGCGTIANGHSQHVQGKYNAPLGDSYAHIVGNGSSKSDRKNVHTLDWNGNAWFAGKATVSVQPTDNNDLTTKKYVDDIAANKVDVVEGKALVNTGEIARLSKVDNYNDAEVRGLIEDLSESKADATSIPTKVSQLTNDSGFLTAVPATYATQAYVADAINKAQLDGSDSEIDLSPYALTSDLALKADKTELHTHENQTLLNSITEKHLTSMAEISDTLNGPRNYYNAEAITDGVYLNSNGLIYENSIYFTTDYIPIAPGQTLYFYGANGRYDVQVNARFVGFFDIDRHFIADSVVSYVNQITNTHETGAYIRITVQHGGWGLGYVENIYPGVDIKYGEIPESKLWEKPQKIDVFLPDNIYCAVGTTIELYNNQVCLQADKLHLNWCCDYGHAMKRKFSFEGTNALAGQIIPVTLEIYNDYNVLKYTKTIQIHVVAATITNPITCVPIGDSWTNQKPWPGEVINLSGEKVSFVGKFTATVKDANGNWREYNHEGRSGFSAYDYDGAHAYTFGNAGEDTHHAFYNPTTARFDWNNYVNTVLGGTQPGAVILQMGINGIAADNTGMVGHEVNMINLIRQDNADIPIFVTLPAYKGNQDGLGIQESSDGHAYHRGVYDYLEKQKVMNYCSLLYEACKDMVGVYFIPLNICFDSEYNYGAQEVPVNPRATSIIEKIPMEAVHPQDYGYYQMADIVYSVMCGNLS